MMPSSDNNPSPDRCDQGLPVPQTTIERESISISMESAEVKDANASDIGTEDGSRQDNDKSVANHHEGASNNRIRNRNGNRNGNRNRGGEDNYVKCSDFHALQIKLEALELTQRREIEEHKREVENQKREIEAQRLQIQELEASQEELKAFLPIEIPLGTSTSSSGIDNQKYEMPLGGMGMDNRNYEMPPGGDESQVRFSVSVPRDTQAQSRRETFTFFRNYQLLFGNGNFETLEHDTFTLMMLADPWSRSWALGLASFLFQMILGTMIALNQTSLSVGSSIFNVPFKVDPIVRAGQFLTIVLCLLTQSDVITTIQSLILLGWGSNWDEVIGEPGKKSHCLWIIRILFPNLLKFAQGLLVMFVSFVIIVQSDDIIELLKDFTALMVLSETDNIMFYIASQGYLGRELLNKALDTKSTSIDTTHSHSFGGGGGNGNDNSHSPAPTTVRSTLGKILLGAFCFRPLILLALFAPMLGGCARIVHNQRNGVYFRQKYPKCNFTGAFELAQEQFGDGVCYGGPLNTLDCDFEGGDCVLFNLAYPLCKGRDDLILVQDKVDNGVCDLLFTIPECDYDGGDCCPYDILNDPKFGDGQCDGGRISTMQCGYDNGDCNTYNRLHPECPYLQLEELEKLEILGNIVLGDGVCDSGIYNTKSCGYEYGDCDAGMLGQDIIVEGANDAFPIFTMELSFDGTTLALGSGGIVTTGFVEVYMYDEKRKIWVQKGDIMMGELGSDFGLAISVTDNGNRMAIGAPNSDDGLGRVQVMDYVPSDNTWVQIGQTFHGNGRMSWTGQKVQLNKDGTRLAIAEPSKMIGMFMMAGQISIYELDTTSNLWNSLGNVITGDTLFSVIGYDTLHLSSFSGNTVVFSSGGNANKSETVTKVYNYDNYSQDWIQVGEDIPTPYVGDSAFSSNGDRIVVALNVTRSDAPGEVRAFEFDEESVSWKQIGKTIFGYQSSEGDGFGYKMDISGDGQLLSVSSIDPDCDAFPSLCATGQVELYLFDPSENDFMGMISKHFSEGIVFPKREQDILNSVYGAGVSLRGDGSSISIGGYNLKDNKGFVRVYQLDEWFYPRCPAKDRQKLRNNQCDDEFPYNSELCEFDSGYCPLPKQVPGLPGCFVSYTNKTGDGECTILNLEMYNTSECKFEGGDCL